MQIRAGQLFRAAILACAIAGVAAAQDVVAISGIITTRADGLPVPGAIVSIVGTSATATADSAGRYKLAVPRSSIHGERIQVKVEALGLLQR